MAAKARTAKSISARSKSDSAVETFLRELKHPLKKEIESVRRIVRSVSPEIQEGIKWNSPSFRTTEWFGTLNLREGRVWLILHLGAKAKGRSAETVKSADPNGLIKWLGKDRGLVTFDDAKDVQAKQAALVKIIKAWIPTIPKG